MKVYELLDKPEKWCQKIMCKNANGGFGKYHVLEDACCWCLEGAVRQCYGGPSFVLKNSIWNKIGEGIKKREGEFWVVYEWNDAPERTYEEVIALCKELDI